MGNTWEKNMGNTWEHILDFFLSGLGHRNRDSDCNSVFQPEPNDNILDNISHISGTQH